MEKTPLKYCLDESLGYLTARVSKSILRQIGISLGENSLPVTPEDFTFLVHLWNENGISQKSLGQSMQREKTTVAKLAARIESRGLITRKPGSDGREKRLYLTESGLAVMSEVTQVVQEILNEAEGAIPENELTICKNVLREVFGNLQRRGKIFSEIS